MVYKIFRKNLLFQDDFLIDCGRPKSRQDCSEQPRSCLGSQIHDTSGVCGWRGDSSCSWGRGRGHRQSSGWRRGAGSAWRGEGPTLMLLRTAPHPLRAVLCPWRAGGWCPGAFPASVKQVLSCPLAEIRAQVFLPILPPGPPLPYKLCTGASLDTLSHRCFWPATGHVLAVSSFSIRRFSACM